jgi:hypothetical protein
MPAGEKMKTIIVAIALALASASNAAEIEMYRTPYSEIAPYLVRIKGRIERRDVAAFENAINKTEGQVFVDLQSPGGDLAAGVLIGVLIHQRGYITLLNKGINWGTLCQGGECVCTRSGGQFTGECVNVCASACAAIWLAGKRRFLQSGSFLGFHASNVNGQPSYQGDNVLREYYRTMGLRSDTIQALLSYGPQSIIWITRELATSLGIDSELWVPRQYSGPGPISPEKPLWKYYDDHHPPEKAVETTKEKGSPIRARLYSHGLDGRPPPPLKPLPTDPNLSVHSPSEVVKEKFELLGR